MGQSKVNFVKKDAPVERPKEIMLVDKFGSLVTIDQCPITDAIIIGGTGSSMGLTPHQMMEVGNWFHQVALWRADKEGNNV